ncbi:MAG: hypothetical protein AAFW98_08715, partial [Pseudomonadota bacterium]
SQRPDGHGRETMSDTDTNTPTQGREPSRARALLSTADMKLLRRALESHARTTEDREELAKINALHHRLGTYVPSAE